MNVLNPIKRLVRACGVESTRSLVRLWEEPPFAEIYSVIRDTTLVCDQRCLVLYALAQQCAAVPGALAEVGVYRGGTAYLLARARPERALYLFDTFSGMPTTDPVMDVHREGDFADTSLESVRRFVAADSAIFRPGMFPNSAAGLEDQRFALVHVDCDIYSSVRACCEWFYPRMNPGGVMAFDDYGVKSCPGARRAIDEFFRDKPERPIPSMKGQVLVFRLDRGPGAPCGS